MTDKQSGAFHPSLGFVTTSEAMLDLLKGVRTAPTGGAERQLILMSQLMSAKGFPVNLIVPVGDDGFTRHNMDGIGVTAGIDFPIGIKFLRALKPIRGVRRSLRAVNADLYFAWGVSRNTCIVALHCMRRGIPFVFGVMSNMDLDGTYELKLNYSDRLLFKYVIKHASDVFSQTELQQDILYRHSGRRGHVVRNICSVPDDADPCTKRDCIVWAGSFRAVKRPEMLLELAARLPDENFVMVGGPNGAEPGLFRKIAQKAESLSNVRLVGQLPFDETTQYYKRAKLFVMTSKVEGFPNVLLEAWSVGTPAVSTFDPDGLITKHNLGYHCTDVDDLVSRIRELSTDNEKKLAMGDRAIQYVRSNHDPEVIADQLEELFTNLYANSPHGRKNKGLTAKDDDRPEILSKPI